MKERSDRDVLDRWSKLIEEKRKERKVPNPWTDPDYGRRDGYEEAS